MLLAFFSRGSRTLDQTLRACSMARQAGADLVYVGERSVRPTLSWADEVFVPEMSEGLAAQLYLAPLQLVSYHVAKIKGLDPNVFVHIVKTWTT
jgi:glucosamine 6-phosphate synthetase-like amidotransferase/phosphosugar isomerase protein